MTTTIEWTDNGVSGYVAGTGLLGTGPLSVEEVGDGNLNFVFRVSCRDDPDRSLILKQAPAYIKVLGPDFPLTQQRLAVEARAMALYDRIAPGSVPKPLRFDAEAHILLMEDLRGYRILRSALIEGDIRPAVAAAIGTFMGSTHRSTLADELAADVQARYLQDFDNAAMQAITADYVFTKPFQQDMTNRHTEGLEATVADVRANGALQAEIRQLRSRFVEAHEGLVHGDLHTGSVMVRGDDTRIIDGEFAFYGPIAFDVGALAANYLLSWHAHRRADDGAARRAALIDCVESCWRAYGEAFGASDRLAAIWREALQFAGVEMLRRILGAAHVDDLESIEDLGERRAAESCAIACGRALITYPPAGGDLRTFVGRFA